MIPSTSRRLTRCWKPIVRATGRAGSTSNFVMKAEAADVVSAWEALDRLKQGNSRFVSGVNVREMRFAHTRRQELVHNQNPFAIILGCSDSRVPAELVFDQGLGDLFVIRVAGNIVMSSQIGSVEFAAEKFGTKLVVVLGHSQCGAVLATLDELKQPTGARSPNLAHIVDSIRPSVENLFTEDVPNAGEGHRENLVRECVRANIRASVNRLRHGSAILENLIREERLLVTGAEYALDSGAVEFLDDSP
jgi:carbonic anhydrase